MEVQTGSVKEIADHAEQIPRLRVASGPNMRLRLFGGAPVAAPSFSNPTVALI
jgi:hypothetical protein